MPRSRRTASLARTIYAFIRRYRFSLQNKSNLAWVNTQYVAESPRSCHRLYWADEGVQPEAIRELYLILKAFPCSMAWLAVDNVGAAPVADRYGHMLHCQLLVLN